MYLDKYGLIVTKDGDTGDTLAEVGRFHFWCRVLRKLGFGLGDFPNSTKEDYKNAIKYLEIQPGILVRHHDPREAWHKDPNETSRDQEISNIATMGEDKHESLRTITYKRLSRFGRYQNRDVANPEHWGVYVRANRAYWLYPFLGLTEVSVGLSYFLSPWYLLLNLISPGAWSIAGAIVQCVKGYQHFDKHVGDDLNGTVQLTQARIRMPTLCSQLAKWIYSNFRVAWVPVTAIGELGEGVVEVTQWRRSWDSSGIQYAFDRYYRAEANSNPEMAELVKPIVRTYFKQGLGTWLIKSFARIFGT